MHERVEQLSADRYDRHPQFDMQWEKHGRLVWKLSTLMAKRLNRVLRESGKGPRCYFTSRDFVGIMTTWFNYCLHRWKPEKAQLSTVLYCQFSDFVFRYFLQWESEDWRCWYWNRTHDTRREVITESEAARAYYESDFFLYRCPDSYDDAWAVDIIGLFETTGHLWEYLCRELPDTAVNVMLYRFRDGLTLRQTSQLLGITYQAVQQAEKRTLVNFRKKIQKLDLFRRLFADSGLADE